MALDVEGELLDYVGYVSLKARYLVNFSTDSLWQPVLVILLFEGTEPRLLYIIKLNHGSAGLRWCKFEKWGDFLRQLANHFAVLLILFHFLNDRLDLCEVLLKLLEDTLEVSFHGFHYFNLDSLFVYLWTHHLKLVQRVLDQLNVNQKLVRQVYNVGPLLVQLKFHLRYLAKIRIKHGCQRIHLGRLFMYHLFLLS